MDIVIITGMSGSGKSEAMNVMEDMGYYCIDNLPPEIIPKMVTLSADSKGQLDKLALGVDIRGYQFLDGINNTLDFLEQGGFDYKIVFLEANDETIVKRYKMSRRRHPLSNGDDILQGIFREKTLLANIRQKADFVIDTSNFLPIDLRGEIFSLFKDDTKSRGLVITIISFGFKYGIPIDADLVFDVRFMPNPYYVAELKYLTGNEPAVQEYVMNDEKSVEFLDKLQDMLDFLIPMYIKEGKNHLVIAIGCTGGHHRSVTVSNLIYTYLLNQKYSVFLKHRDIKNQ